MPRDHMKRIGRSLIQHGHYNDRIYIIHLAREDCPAILPELAELAEKEGYTKIVGKVPHDLEESFLNGGYVTEARIPGYYAGEGDALYMGCFLDPQREVEHRAELVEDVLSVAQKQKPVTPPPAEGYELCPQTDEEAPAMARLYGKVFPSYPFPIHDPEFLVSTMDTVSYYGMCKGDEVAALASADKDRHARSVEMTDFATLPEHGGKGLAAILLRRMEEDVARQGYRTAFTIARACSHPMNITFARAGYSFGGKLKNNSNIYGEMESMNIWYRLLA